MLVEGDLGDECGLMDIFSNDVLRPDESASTKLSTMKLSSLPGSWRNFNAFSLVG